MVMAHSWEGISTAVETSHRPQFGRRYAKCCVSVEFYSSRRSCNLENWLNFECDVHLQKCLVLCIGACKYHCRKPLNQKKSNTQSCFLLSLFSTAGTSPEITLLSNTSPKDCWQSFPTTWNKEDLANSLFLSLCIYI